jgi:zinc transport system substrate-binding protein
MGYTPNVEADPSAIARVVTAAEENGVEIIFYDQPENLPLAETIASEAGAKAMRLHPIESLSDEELAAGEDYFSLMRKNLAVLKEALA